MRLLTTVILSCLAAMALGFVAPERWGLLAFLAAGLLFTATVLLGLAQLKDVTRRRN